jgi:hypothetical protein
MFLPGEDYKDAGLDGEFEEESESEFQRLFFLGKLISELEESSRERWTWKSFRKKCRFAIWRGRAT